jgi:hypothetical protein
MTMWPRFLSVGAVLASLSLCACDEMMESTGFPQRNSRITVTGLDATVTAGTPVPVTVTVESLHADMTVSDVHIVFQSRLVTPSSFEGDARRKTGRFTLDTAGLAPDMYPVYAGGEVSVLLSSMLRDPTAEVDVYERKILTIARPAVQGKPSPPPADEQSTKEEDDDDDVPLDPYAGKDYKK